MNILYCLVIYVISGVRRVVDSECRKASLPSSRKASVHVCFYNIRFYICH